MMQEFIVRADFYPTGEVIPLGITDNNGITHYIEKVLETKKLRKDTIQIKCKIEGSVHWLCLNNNIWTLLHEIE